MDEATLRARLEELERRVDETAAVNRALAVEVAELRAQLGLTRSAIKVAPPPVKPAASRRAVLVLLGIVVLALTIGGGGFLLLRGAFAEQFSGQVAVSNSAFGSFSFQVTDCDSGASYTPPFFGADLKADGQQLRIYNSGDDASLALWRPGTKQTMDVGRNACSRWDVLVDWAHVRVNQVATVNGHLHVTCTLPGGGALVADAEFTRCAF